MLNLYNNISESLRKKKQFASIVHLLSTSIQYEILQEAYSFDVQIYHYFAVKPPLNSWENIDNVQSKVSRLRLCNNESAKILYKKIKYYLSHENKIKENKVLSYCVALRYM